MKLTFLGVGSAFTMNNYQSNMLFETSVFRNDGTPSSPDMVEYSLKLLIDAGGDVRYALRDINMPSQLKELERFNEEIEDFASKFSVPASVVAQAIARERAKSSGVNVSEIDALYVSHCHADHVGGIEWLGFSRYFSRGKRPELYINERLAGSLWNDSLRGGMASHQGRVLELDSFFSKVHRVPKNKSFQFGDATFTPVQTVHYMDGYEIVPSYGLIFNRTKFSDDSLVLADALFKPKEYFLTTDTQFCPNQIMDFYNRAHLIFQDCETYTWDQEDYKKSGVHAHYRELVTLPAEVKAKMWLYHYNDGPLPNAKSDGFLGFIEKGQVFELD